MPHNFRDIQGIAGVAPARTVQESEMSRSRARLWGEVADEGKSAAFANPTANVTLMRIDPGMKVADFGSGSGAYVIAAARVVGASGRVYAVDVQKDLLARIKNNAEREGLKQVEVIWGDFEKESGTHLKDASLDFVIMSNVLFQVDRPQAAFAEAARVLKPAGKIGVIDWSDSFGGMGPRASRVVPKEKALELAQAGGFALAREFKAGAHHYGLLLKKQALA